MSTSTGMNAAGYDTATPTSAMSTSTGMNAAGYNLIQLLTVFHIMYIFTLSGSTNIVMNVISEILVFTISWIKLLVNFAKF
jgi:hypothetical protein